CGAAVDLRPESLHLQFSALSKRSETRRSRRGVEAPAQRRCEWQDNGCAGEKRTPTGLWVRRLPEEGGAAARLFARLSQREADGDELHADLGIWTDDRMVTTACCLALRFSDKLVHLNSPNDPLKRIKRGDGPRDPI